MSVDDNWRNRVILSSTGIVEDMVSVASDDLLLSGKINSPIEAAFAVSAKLLIKARYPEFAFDDAGVGLVRDLDVQLEHTEKSKVWGIVLPQVQIDRYRVDFVVRYFWGLDTVGGIVVECDGHEFHEKTKEQAARDKERDRELQAGGYQVFRFTGREIWADPIECADSVLSLVYPRAHDSLIARMSLARGDAVLMAKHLRYAMQ